MAGEEGEGAQRQTMERNDVLFLQSRRSTPPFNLKVTINKRWQPESDGEASEGGRGGRGESARSASDGVQRCAVPTIACPNTPLTFKITINYGDRGRSEGQRSGGGGMEGWRREGSVSDEA
jgi:hypothetical protein